MNKKQFENESKKLFFKSLDLNLQKPKPVSNSKVDRYGSKTAPIEADFVKIKFNN